MIGCGRIVLVSGLTALLFAGSATADRLKAGGETSLEKAADTAEVFVYGRESKNEALLREISDPDQYDAMAHSREESHRKLNENVRVTDVEITETTGDRAVAKATYEQIQSKEKSSAVVHMKRVDGKWEVTTPPEPAAK